MAGLFSRLVTLGIGIYAGIFIDQHYQVPRVDDPSQLLADVNEWLEKYKRDKPKGD